MDTTLISWNVPNMVTIWLMAAIGFLVIGIIAQLVLKKRGGADANNSGVY